MGFGDILCSDQLHILANFNLLAPTTHNTVPQRFRFLHGGALEIWLDRTHVLEASDATGRQAQVSIGCGLTNTLLAARHYGFTGHVEWAPLNEADLGPLTKGAQRYVRVATAYFKSESQTIGAEWIDAMLDRRSVRTIYDNSVKLDPMTVADLQSIASKRSGIGLHLITDSSTLFALGKFQETADTTVFNREKFARELGDWLLPNNAESHFGMRGREFGLDDETTLRMHLGLRGVGTLLPDEMAGVARSARLGFQSSTAGAVLTVDADDAFHRIRAGEVFEEIALALRIRGFCIATHAAISEVEIANLALRARLRTRARPTVVFRFGVPRNRSDTEWPHSVRPGIEEVTLLNDPDA
jgi:hypothetical protein